MTKFSLLALIVAIAIGLHDVAVSADIPTNNKVEDKIDDTVETNDDRRSGSYAYASLSVQQQPSYGPTPMLVSPPNVGRTSPMSHALTLVECYACTDCPQILPNTTTKWCPKTYDFSTRSACVSYAEQYRYLKKNWYIRGCATERGSCADIKRSHSSHSEIVKLLFCDECEGDRCNTSGASRSFTDLTLAIITLLIAPLVAKSTLS